MGSSKPPVEFAGLELDPDREAGGGRANESNGLRESATAIMDKRILEEEHKVIIKKNRGREVSWEEIGDFGRRWVTSERTNGKGGETGRRYHGAIRTLSVSGHLCIDKRFHLE